MSVERSSSKLTVGLLVLCAVLVMQIMVNDIRRAGYRYCDTLNNTCPTVIGVELSSLTYTVDEDVDIRDVDIRDGISGTYVRLLVPQTWDIRDVRQIISSTNFKSYRYLCELEI